MSFTKRGFRANDSRPSLRSDFGANRSRGRAGENMMGSGGGNSTGARLLPHSIEAEESVLGGILLDSDAINAALETLQPEDFYKPANSIIYDEMRYLSEHHQPIDIVTITHRLKGRDALTECGGLEYLTQLSKRVPSAANVAYYAKLVKEFSLRRKVIKEASDIINEAFSEDAPIEEFLDGAESRILGVSEARASRSFFHVNEVVRDSIKIIEELFDKKEKITGVATGFVELDHKTAGLQPSDLIIVAARPAMGKTSLALGVAAHAAMERKKGVAIFSLEMSKEQLVLRLLCSEAMVDSGRVRTGHLGERDFPKLVEAASRLAEAPIFIDDSGGLTITEVRAKARRLHKEHPLGMIIVDYLQLLRSPQYSSFREQEISDISRNLKSLAKELRVPVVALSQLNRSVEGRENKRPQMSDLRESGAIEQDADVIMFIYRDEVYNEDSTEKGIAEIIISKQRNGPTGTVKLAFASELTRFDNLAITEHGEAIDSGSFEAPDPIGIGGPTPGILGFSGGDGEDDLF